MLSVICAYTAIMHRQVSLENWQEQLEATIEAVRDEAGVHPSASAERAALLDELPRLLFMRQQVRGVAAKDRERVASVLLPWSVREPLHLPDELVSRVGELFDVYRRFHTRQSWRN